MLALTTLLQTSDSKIWNFLLCLSEFEQICPSRSKHSVSFAIFLTPPSMFLLCSHTMSSSRWPLDVHTSKKSADYSEAHLGDTFFSRCFISHALPAASASVSSYSPVPDGDDAFPASRQHWPSACGLVPVHPLWLVCQQSSTGLPVQLPACHRGIGRSHLWWVETGNGFSGFFNFIMQDVFQVLADLYYVKMKWIKLKKSITFT